MTGGEHRRPSVPVPGAGRALRRAGARAAATVVVAALLVPASGCATKRDVRDLRADFRREIADVKAQQDTILDLLQLQRQAILDSLVQTTERLIRVRGELGHELSQLRDQLIQITELTGEVQNQLVQFRREMDRRIDEVAAGTGPAQVPASPESNADARELYDIGIEQRNRGNLDTARQAFQQVVEEYPDDPLAPQALRQMAEMLYLEDDYAGALGTLESVVERYEASPEASQALYRAGIIAKERGNNERATEYFRRVVDAYPQSDAAVLAERELQRLGG